MLLLNRAGIISLKYKKQVEGVRCVPRCHGSTCFIFSRASWSKGPKASPISHNILEYSWFRTQFACALRVIKTQYRR